MEGDYTLVFEEDIEGYEVIKFKGGFVIFNMPFGYRNLTIIPNHRADNILNKVFVAEPNVVNVL